MANTTFMATVNKVLELAGQRQVASSNDFNSPTTNLGRVQQQARAFVDLANRMLLVQMNKRFMQREYSFTTNAGTYGQPSTNIYTLDSSTDSESLIYHSFFNTTPQINSLTPITARSIINWEYREFRQLYPDFTVLALGPPQRWILLPPPIAGGLMHQIMFFPMPDAAYSIIYQAKLNMVPLSLDSQQIAWPIEYEHILWLYGKLFLEQALGEGKEGDLERYVQLALSEVKKWAGGPEEVRHAIRIGLQIDGVARGRRVSKFFTSTNT